MIMNNNYPAEQFPQGFSDFNQYLEGSPQQQPQQSQHHIQPDLVSESPPVNTIKERLNLHVKRKLLEYSTSTVVSQHQPSSLQQMKTDVSLSKSLNSSNTIKRTRKNKKNDYPSTSRSATNTVLTNTKLDGNVDDRCQETKLVKTLEPNSVTIPTSAASMSTKEKVDNTKKIDILAQILNHKKMALMNDPEIIKLLTTMTQKIIHKKQLNVDYNS